MAHVLARAEAVPSTSVGLFTKAPKVGADGYERTSIRGYVDKGKVAKLLAEGWEIESATPVQIGGTSIKQSMFMLRRRATS